MSGNAFRGVSADQDARFRNKEKKLLKTLAKSFPQEFETKVDLTRVNWEAMKPWIARRLTELLGGVEDDVLIGYVYEQLEGKTEVDPRILQINLTGFLEKNTSLFCKELWTLLISAAEGPSGIPQKFLDEKAAELREREGERRRIQAAVEAERERQRKLRHESREAKQRERYQDDRRSRDRRRYSRSRSGERGRRRSRSASRDSVERHRHHRSPSPSRDHRARHGWRDNEGKRYGYGPPVRRSPSYS